jgi:tRNA G18 (ribose-2'-O)-methylase SpoU
MMGSEEDGISHEYLKSADEQVKIPLPLKQTTLEDILR